MPYVPRRLRNRKGMRKPIVLRFASHVTHDQLKAISREYQRRHAYPLLLVGNDIEVFT